VYVEATTAFPFIVANTFAKEQQAEPEQKP